MIILHDSRVAESRRFVESYGEGHTVIDWGNPEDTAKVQAYCLTGIPVSAFPSVYDPEKGKLSRVPMSMDVAIDEINGFGNQDAALNTVKQRIDAKTEEIIKTRFIHNNIHFQLTQEFQLNLLGLVQVKDVLVYADVKIKGKSAAGDTVYYSPADASELTAFYAAGLAHIQGAYQSGWILKDSLVSMTIDELKRFEDLR